MRKWLKQMRLARKLTQEQLASMVDVDTTTINKIELGHRRPSVEIAKAIAKELGFDWAIFFEECERTSA